MMARFPDHLWRQAGGIGGTIRMSYGGRPRLIFDIGASEGSDTAFYLAKGFDVIAVEADPIAYAALCSRFREFIDQGRLIVCNRAAAERPGEQVAFLHNPDEQGLSSLRNSGRITNGIEYHVETITWPELVELKGVPYYAKVDIEGGEPPFLKSITPNSIGLPKFFSAECSTPQPIALLHELGYRRFRLMNQLLVNQFPPPEPPREGNFVPTTGMHNWSGLFGEELPGEQWLDFSEITDVYQRLHSLWSLRTLIAGWLDVHARWEDDN
jgi:FkbM family methyltransferase